MSTNDVVVFKDGELEIEVSVSPDEETVWLSQKQISELFEKGRSTITEHINNIFKEGELDESSNVGFSDIANSNKPVKVYNLDVIISVGYRVKSNRGIAFRKWASSILKDYMMKGYALNEKKLNIPDYQELLGLLNSYRQIDGQLSLSSDTLLDFLMAYEKGLRILDEYDHHAIKIPVGTQYVYKL